MFSFQVDDNQTLLQIIPIDEKGKLQEAFDVRIDEMNILDLKFLDGCERPTLAVLHEDAKSERHIKTYVVDARPNVKVSPLMLPAYIGNAKHNTFLEIAMLTIFLKMSSVKFCGMLAKLCHRLCYLIYRISV